VSHARELGVNSRVCASVLYVAGRVRELRVERMGVMMVGVEHGGLRDGL
jgi:hypothetical protein